MITVQYARTMARYNRWMNDKVYAAAATLSAEQRRRDVGAFFKSIHGTLNHLLVADRLWLARFRAQPAPYASLNVDLHPDFDELRAARLQTDMDIDAFAANLTEAQLAGSLTFRTVTAPRDRTLPYALVVMQLFNHQTHHRGQVTTLLKQMGADPGATDLPAMPEFASYVHTPLSK